MRFIHLASLVASLIFNLSYSAATAADFSHPKYYLGFTNYQGKANLWTEIAPLKLADGTTIPVRLLFSTEPFSGTPVFGRFWYCPILESIVIPFNETHFVFRTLGGRQVFLKINEDNPGEMESGDRRFHGRRLTPGKLVITGEGWEYEFINGRLRSAKSDTGVTLDWAYNNGRIRAISDRQKGDLLSLDYQPGEPLPTDLVINGKRFRLKSQNVPIAQSVMGQTLIAGYSPSLAEIDRGLIVNGYPIRLDREGLFHMDCTPESKDRHFVWGANDGILKSDGEWSYGTTTTKGIGPKGISRTDKKGRTESYVYDSRVGKSVYTSLDGTTTRRLYFVTPGLTQYKIRRLTKLVKGQEIKNARWSYDESGRLIRKIVGDRILTWNWGDTGKLASFTEKIGERIVKNEIYDSEGKLQTKIRNGIAYRYFYEGGKTIVQRLDGDRVVAAQVNSAEGNAKTFFTNAAKAPELLRLPGGKTETSEIPQVKELVKKYLLREKIPQPPHEEKKGDSDLGS